MSRFGPNFGLRSIPRSCLGALFGSNPSRETGEHTRNFITRLVSSWLLLVSFVPKSKCCCCCCQNVLAFSHSRGLSSGKSMRHDIEETNTSFPAVNDSNSQLWGFGFCLPDAHSWLKSRKKCIIYY